jgi:cell division transport system permease protein
LGNLGYYIREGFSGLRRGGGGSAGAVLTVVLALLVIGVVLLVVHNLQLAVADAREEVRVEVYLSDEVGPQQLSPTEERIKAVPGVGPVEYISPAAALDELRRMLGEDAYLLSEIEENPLPASFRVTLEEGWQTDDKLAEAAGRLEAIPGVMRVSYGREWVESLTEIVRLAGLIGVAIGGVLVLAALLVVGNAVSLSVYHRREEIAILKIVGAPSGFIRRPFVFEGFLVGLLGGGLGVGILYLLYTLAGPLLEAQGFLPWQWSAGLVGLGALVGIVGSFFAAAKHIRRAK